MGPLGALVLDLGGPGVSRLRYEDTGAYDLSGVTTKPPQARTVCCNDEHGVASRARREAGRRAFQA